MGQLAAIVALLAAVGVLVIFASAVVEDLVDVLLAFVSVFVVAFSGWFVLTRRGVRRLLGVPGVLLGLAGMIGFVGDHWLDLFVLIGLLALFGIAGRYAVRCERGTAHTVHTRQRRVQPARTGVLIINPNSGGGKAKRFNLPEEARKRGVEPCCSGAVTTSAGWPREHSQMEPT